MTVINRVSDQPSEVVTETRATRVDTDLELRKTPDHELDCAAASARRGARGAVLGIMLGIALWIGIVYVLRHL